MVRQNRAEIAPIPSSWEGMLAQAGALVRSGLLPNAIKAPETALAIMLTGAELGLGPMLSLRSIHIIEGRPTLSADLMAALVHREIDRHGDGLLMALPPTPQAATVRYRRWGWPEPLEFTYAMEDAQRAGLATRDTWKRHPAQMLKARAISTVCRMSFSDVVAGLYTEDEVLDALDSEPSRLNPYVKRLDDAAEDEGDALPFESAAPEPEASSPVAADAADAAFDIVDGEIVDLGDEDEPGPMTDTQEQAIYRSGYALRTRGYSKADIAEYIRTNSGIVGPIDGYSNDDAYIVSAVLQDWLTALGHGSDEPESGVLSEEDFAAVAAQTDADVGGG
jgi:hypothetical protein